MTAATASSQHWVSRISRRARGRVICPVSSASRASGSRDSPQAKVPFAEPVRIDAPSAAPISTAGSNPAGQLSASSSGTHGVGLHRVRPADQPLRGDDQIHPIPQGQARRVGGRRGDRGGQLGTHQVFEHTSRIAGQADKWWRLCTS